MHPATIGPFKILRELGRGGMGEVYLAHDTRLDRQVAIKALPADLAEDPDRLARFQREAKVLASLNHPGIGAIYGLEQAAGHQYLILEFIEGETLADRLERGPLPLDEALPMARQIAEALEVAHEKGIVHRDLKPGNIMVGADGAAKVLDFGLARTADGPVSSMSALASADSPTLVSPARAHSPTIPGAIMGTAGYMSPEQARGKTVDKRSDIFSFGCVFYEMLTGIMPFRGETVADAIGATLHKDIDLKSLPPAIPPRVRDLLTNCLAKDRKRRLHDIGDARLELDRTIDGHDRASTAPQPSPQRSLVIAASSLLAATAGLAAGWSLFSRSAPPAVPARTFHVSTAIPSKPRFGTVSGISPDSSFLICQVWPELPPESMKPSGQLMLRRLNRDETKLLDGTEGAYVSALSPDGRWVAFMATKDRSGPKATLKKLTLTDGQPTGAPETLCEFQRGPGSLCWGSNQQIVLASSFESTLQTVPASGGEPKVLLRDQASTGIENWGAMRPLVDGKSILASRWSLIGQTIKEHTEVIDLISGKASVVLQGAGTAQYIPAAAGAMGATGGYLLAMKNQNSLIAAPFDLGTLQVTGTPVTVWSGQPLETCTLSPGGTLAMASSAGDPTGRRLAWLDKDGLAQPVPGQTRAFGNVRLSPDGGRVMFTLDQAGSTELPTELWVLDITRRTVTRLPTQGVPIDCGTWSNDGERITYGVVGETESAIWERRADGAGEAVKLYALTGNNTLLIAKGWSPDGKTLLVTQVDLAAAAADTVLLEQRAGSKQWVASPYLNSKANEDQPAFSADGKWMQFISTESGRSELYVQRYTGAASGAEDAKAGRKQISTGGTNNGASSNAWWSPDGKELRFIDADEQVQSVQIKTEPTFSASLPKVFYSMKDLKTRSAAFAPDGRIMVVLPGENEQITKVELIINFLDELRAKMAPPKQ